MGVFEEFEHLLPHDLVVISLVVSAHRLELVDHIDDLLLRRSALDHILQSRQMLHRIEEDLFRLAGLLSLVLHSHEHEIEELPHARCVKFHYGAVGELLEHFACADHRVHLLRFE